MRIYDFGHSSGGRRGGHLPPDAHDIDQAHEVTALSRASRARRHATPGRGPHPSRAHRERPFAFGVPTELGALTLLAPLLASALLAARLPPETGFQVMEVCFLAQLVLVALVLRRSLRWARDRRELDIAGVGDSTELEARREKDRLHEVRATVAGIGMTHRLLRERRDRMSADARTKLECLYDREIARLERLLDDEVRAGNEMVNVQAAVDPVVDSLRLRGHRVDWGGSRAFAVGRGDDISEILYILFENAARHAPGSEISVRVESTPTQVVLRVSDDGPGVPAALAPRLFERGIRAPESPGEGIGLHIAPRLAREMGGALVLDPDSTCRGAAFNVVLRASIETVPCLARLG